MKKPSIMFEKWYSKKLYIKNFDLILKKEFEIRWKQSSHMKIQK